MTKRARTVLGGMLLAALAALPGCGTIYQGHQLTGPAIFGGLRLDVNQFSHEESGIGDCIFYCIDMPFSLAGDVGLLLFSIPNEIIGGGIDVLPERPIHLDDPRYVCEADSQDERQLAAKR